MNKSLNMNRSGEAGNVPLRTDRYFSIEHDWYFSTREGAAVGPFDNKAMAVASLNDFVEFLSLASPKVLTILFKSLKENAKLRYTV